MGGYRTQSDSLAEPLDQAMVQSEGNGLKSGVHLELLADPLDVRSGGVRRNEKPRSDARAVEAFDQQREHLALTTAQTRESRCCGVVVSTVFDQRSQKGRHH